MNICNVMAGHGGMPVATGALTSHPLCAVPAMAAAETQRWGGQGAFLNVKFSPLLI